MSDVVSVTDLLSLPIHWQNHKGRYWTVEVHGCLCTLRMNDFPDEPLYTIIVGDESLDIDDPPRIWKIDH